MDSQTSIYKEKEPHLENLPTTPLPTEKDPSSSSIPNTNYYHTTLPFQLYKDPCYISET